MSTHISDVSHKKNLQGKPALWRLGFPLLVKTLLLAFASRDRICSQDDSMPTVGGQAVIEGIMMRYKDHYALALRHADGSISAQRMPWFSLTHGILKLPYLRGFPTLVETLVNGIKSLNRSAMMAAEGEGEDIKGWQLVLTLCVAVGMAMLLFVVVPHLFSLGMKWLGLGGDVEGLSFHLWDGLFKFVIFIGYILAISLVPDIQRVFRYHGAEHKVIRAFESGGPVSVDSARGYSRLHPRCGTTFLLFVLSIAIILHTITVPLLLLFWTPSGAVVKHLGIVLFKLALMVPISALAYECIRYAARLGDSLLGKMLRAPGMFLQLLTTWEPDNSQLEIGIVALAAALGPDAPASIEAPAYTFSE